MNLNWATGKEMLSYQELDFFWGNKTHSILKIISAPPEYIFSNEPNGKKYNNTLFSFY